MKSRERTDISAVGKSWLASLVVAVCLLLIVGINFARAWIHSPSTESYTPTTSSTVANGPSGGVYLGISVHQWNSADLLSNLKRYQSLARKNAAMVMYWRDWADAGAVDPTVMKAIYNQGSVPVISWEPGSYRAPPGPKYSLQSIVAGHWDHYIRTFARALASYHRTVFLRFAHEMNGDWYEWSGQPQEYIAAWRHIHALFRQVGAANVRWVWSPNVNWDGLHPFEAYYPGDAYVDWLGLDGYNRPRTGWNSFSQIIRISYGALTAVADKPVMIAETATGEATASERAAGYSKARWIIDLYGRAVLAMPRIKAVVWFDVDKSQKDANGNRGYDNRIATSMAAQVAYARAVAPRFYRSRWP